MKTSHNTTQIISKTIEPEQLEPRQMFAASYYSIDGTGNNLSHTNWGSTNTAQIRYAASKYADGISSPSGSLLPSARAISNAIAQQLTEDRNNRNLSEYLWIFGQFLDHDIDLTLTSSSESFNIAVPTGDTSFDPNSTGTAIIPLKRSLYDSSTGTTTPRQQLNAITSWIDGSMIYGSDTTTALALRSFIGGKLKTSSGNLLPIDNIGFFQAGDIRANENIVLTAMQTVWMREHNTVATRVAAANPTWNDEQIYQESRKYVIAELQAVVYNEYLPALLGKQLRAYRGYNANVNPSVANEFSTAIFRFGHSTLNDDIDLLSNTGEDIANPIALRDALFNPTPIKTYGVDPVLKYGASSNAGEIDTQVVDELRNFLFGAPGQGGLDLVALNIQRGRDHGLADYNSLRAAMGLSKVTSFSQITSDADLAAKLQSVYGDVNKIDAWVGALAEDHTPGSSVGQLSGVMIADQFTRLRDGDRLYFENTFTGDALSKLRRTRLSDIIARNTSITTLQSNVMFFDVNIGGTLFFDGNRNGLDRGDPRLAGRVVQVLDANGAVVQEVRSDRNGRYYFDDITELGTYKIVSPGLVQTVSVKVDRGADYLGVNLASTNQMNPPPREQPPTSNPPRMMSIIFSESPVLV